MYKPVNVYFRPIETGSFHGKNFIIFYSYQIIQLLFYVTEVDQYLQDAQLLRRQSRRWNL